MSSLRPLATITLLAAVGVFLYMKINETEPVVPADIGQWSPDVAIGDALGTAGLTASTAPPAYEPGAPPPFVPGAAPAPATPPAGATANAAAPSDAAPPFTPGPAAAEDPFKNPSTAATADQGADASTIARTADPPAELPAMPPIPSTAPANPTPTPPAEATTAESAPPLKPPAASAAESANTTPPAAATAPPNDEITPTPAATSMFASVRVAVQGALDRGELAQALLLLSDWYGDPSLTADEAKEVDELLGQLAGSVIYEGPPAHRLEPAYIVTSGETLEDIAAKYDVPAALLAKINGIATPGTLTAGQELKVVRGPFSAIVDVGDRKMTLMLDRRYAGQFAIELDPANSIEDGQWKVDQKLVSPAAGGIYAQPGGSTEDRSLLLANPNSAGVQSVVLRGPGSNDPVASGPAGRVIRLKSGEVNDVYDILSVGSRVTIQR